VHAVDASSSSPSPRAIGALVGGPSVAQNAVIAETSIARNAYRGKYLAYLVDSLENDSSVLAADPELGLAKRAA